MDKVSQNITGFDVIILKSFQQTFDLIVLKMCFNQELESYLKCSRLFMFFSDDIKCCQFGEGCVQHLDLILAPFYLVILFELIVTEITRQKLLYDKNANYQLNWIRRLHVWK